MKTKFHCILCKQFFCIVDRGDLTQDMIIKEHKNVEFMNGVCPPTHLWSIINLPYGEIEEIIVQNSCYHISHWAQIEVTVGNYKKSIISEGKFIVLDDNLDASETNNDEDNDTKED